MNKKIKAIVWIIIIFALLVASYTIYSKNSPKGTIPPSNQELSKSQSAQINNPIAPDFNLKDLNGKNVKLFDYRGKIVILNFWAVWCKYCKQEMPDLNKLNKELEKDNEVVILAIDAQESSDTVKKYLSDNNINLKVLLDQDGSVTQSYNVSGFPTTFFINKDGTLYTYIPGATNIETLKEIIRKIKTGESAE